MAEALAVLGVASSSAQLLEFIVRVFDRLNHYTRRVDEAPESLRGIKLYLPLFIEALRRSQFHIDHGHYDPTISAVFKTFIDECNSQMKLLDDILTKITPSQDDSKRTRYSKAVRSLRQEKTLKKIHTDLSGYIEKLLLFQSTVASNDTMIRMKATQNIQKSLACQETSVMTETSKTPVDKTLDDGESTSAASSLFRNSSKRPSNYHKDENRYRFSSFMGLSRLGVLWALQASIDLSWGSYGFSISPNLQVRRLVKYTSPGFEVLWKARTGQLDIQSACDALFELFNSGRASPQDVDPDGNSLLELVLRISRVLHPDGVIALLRVICEWVDPLNTTTSSLSLCIDWDGRSPLLTLLRRLSSLNFDFSKDIKDIRRKTFTPGEFSSVEPLFILPNEYADIPDPFLLRFFTECSRDTYGVWGQTPLMDAILSGSLGEITKLLQRHRSLQDRNVLGQTPIHVAVLRPNALLAVLEVCPNLDVRDVSGGSPLDYASAYGCVESLLLLLKAGADPIDDGHLGFLDHARTWCHWDLMAQVFDFFRSERRFSDTFLKSEADHLMTKLFGRHPFERRNHPSPIYEPQQMKKAECLKALIGLGANIHHLLDNGDTLLHRVQHVEQAEALFEVGYEYIDRPNLDGRTALMTSVVWPFFKFHNSILARGPNVNHQDNGGLSALHLACWIMSGTLHYILRGFPSTLQDISPIIVLVTKLVHQGADPLSHDNCRCPCSPDGCSPSTKLIRLKRSEVSKDSGGYIWVLEWLLLLKELRGEATAQKALVQLIRAREFDKAGMTHVCCRKLIPSVYRPNVMDEEEIDEILDEEKDFISELDDTMRQLDNNAIDGAVEENWLKILTGIHFPDRHKPKSWNSTTWKGSLTSALPPQGPPPQVRSNPPVRTPEAESYYWTDEAQDEFRMDSISIQNNYGCHPNQLYSEWVKYFYENQKLYDYPSPIDKGWYSLRKYWADRQTEALASDSRTITEVPE